MVVNVLGRLKQEEASLAYVVRPCLKKQTRTNQREVSSEELTGLLFEMITWISGKLGVQLG